MSNVQALIDSARGYTTSLQASAVTAMGVASTAISGIPRSITTFEGFIPPTYNPPTPLGPFPAIPAPAFTAPPQPPTLGMSAVPPVNMGGVPTLTANPLGYNAPTQISPLAAFTGAPPPINTSFAFPTAPALIVPQAPTPGNYPMPTAPQVALPSFTAGAPTDTSTAPTGLDLVYEGQQSGASTSFVASIKGYIADMMADKFPNYQTQMAAIQAQLAKFFAGGTGFNAAAENAIYERAKGKNNAEALRVRDQALNDAAARGFTMPGGALLSAMQQARQGGADNNAKAAAEIVAMQAEMEQKNLQFAVTTATGLQQTAVNAVMAYMQNLTSINGQALEYAKEVVAALIETYNAQVKMYSLRLESYRAQAAVFETQLKSALAGMELYKMQIEALQAMTQIDHLAVEVFSARISALNAQQALYRSQIEAVQAQAGLEKMKLELFQTQVQAYATQVQAKNAEYQGYNAQIEGEVAKTKVFSAQVEAYSAQVQGYKASIEGQVANIQAVAETNKAIGMTNEANLLGYKANIEAQGEVARTQIAVGQTAIQAYEAAAHASMAAASASAEYYKASNANSIAQAQLAATTGIESAKVAIATGEAMARVATGNATIYGNLAGAAMAGMNTLAAESVIS